MAFDHNETLDNFYSGTHQFAVEALQRYRLDPHFALIYLWSAQAAGKTHLLNAMRHDYESNRLSVISIPLEKHDRLQPEMLLGWMICMTLQESRCGKRPLLISLIV